MQNDRSMAAPKNNQYWRLRETDGRPKEYTPDELWEGAKEYFKWNEEHPLIEAVLQQRTGEIIQVPKMRAMTLKGLAIYLGITSTTLENYAKNKDFFGVFTHIRDVIDSQKFEGAASGFFNANIIARDLGLKEQTETKHSGSINLSNLSDAELEKKLNELGED